MTDDEKRIKYAAQLELIGEIRDPNQLGGKGYHALHVELQARQKYLRRKIQELAEKR